MAPALRIRRHSLSLPARDQTHRTGEKKAIRWQKGPETPLAQNLQRFSQNHFHFEVKND
jgi:hypothetical protein